MKGWIQLGGVQREEGTGPGMAGDIQSDSQPSLGQEPVTWNREWRKARRTKKQNLESTPETASSHWKAGQLLESSADSCGCRPVALLVFRLQPAAGEGVDCSQAQEPPAWSALECGAAVSSLQLHGPARQNPKPEETPRPGRPRRPQQQPDKLSRAICCPRASQGPGARNLPAGGLQGHLPGWWH